MPTQIQLRRGTTSEHSSFTGAAGEVTVDTTKKTVVVHDGSTAGGMPLLPKTMSDGTANGVAYLNGSKVLTTGSALTFDGTNFGTTGNITLENSRYFQSKTTGGSTIRMLGINSGNTAYIGPIDSGPGDAIINASSSSANIQFYATGSEQMRLTSTGLGIGTSSPGTKLHISASGTSIALVQATTNNVGAFFRCSGLNGSGSPLVFEAGVNISDNGYEIFDRQNTQTVDLYLPGASGYRAFYTNGTERMRIGTATGGVGAVGIGYTSLTSVGNNGLAVAGNVGIGTSSPTAKLEVNGSFVTTADASGLTTLGRFSSGYAWSLIRPSSTATGIEFRTNAGDALYQLDQSSGANKHIWYTGNTERARIDTSGNFLVGTNTTNRGNSGFHVGNNGQFFSSTDSSTNLNLRRIASNGDAITFTAISGSIVGAITVNTTTTTYNTSSDYRLKNTIAPMTGALAKVALLKPCTYKWNIDGSDGQGFIAHELATVVPQCVTGEKDAVDADGKPVYQGIDTSFLVATLTAAIQELKAEFDAYKASHP